MKKFILLYRGPATDAAAMSDEARQEVMQKWGAWMQKLGEAIVDVGQPMANGEAVVDDGTVGTATLLNGYSIIQAEDMAAAKAHVAGHPFLSDGSGKFAVEVHELLPTPKM